MQLTNEFFELQLRGINVEGSLRKDSRKVIFVTVSGNGSEFNTCVKRIIELAGAKNKGAVNLIVTRFTAHLQRQVNPDEYFEQDGTRYHLQIISGVRTFHCTNARADDRAILRAQPG
jgi:hypothetical protein